MESCGCCGLRVELMNMIGGWILLFISLNWAGIEKNEKKKINKHKAREVILLVGVGNYDWKKEQQTILFQYKTIRTVFEQFIRDHLYGPSLYLLCTHRLIGVVVVSSSQFAN